MPYEACTYAQDSGTGRVGEVLSGITATAQGAGMYTAVDAAVAYASHAGARLLASRLAPGPHWIPASKRFLISIDYGITDPRALRELSQIPNAEVRVPNGRAVLGNTRLAPPSTFHAKGYLFRDATWASPSGMIIGSANMTVSALATGSEVVVGHVWSGTLSQRDRALLRSCTPFLDWFEDAWLAADPLTAILTPYRARYRSQPAPRGPQEERTPATKAFKSPPATSEVVGPLVVQLGAAQALWFQTDDLYENRGPGVPGNQLDTPRGTRVFFGFPTRQRPRNTVLGYIELQVPGHTAVERSVRFADNSMDKVNLPVPGRGGPATYSQSILIFDRAGFAASGRRLFRLTVTDDAGLAARKAAAANFIDLRMSGGREYGLLF